MHQIPNWVKRWTFAGVATLLGFGLMVSGIQTWSDWIQLQVDATDQNKRKFDTSLEFTKAIIGLIGTSATIVGGVFLYVNYIQAQDKLNHEKEKAKKDIALAESRLITERFSKAVEQLGSDKMDVRIGGIYALEQIAKDSVKYPDLQGYHWTVMEVLTAFIRERSPVQPKKQNQTFAASFLASDQESSELKPVTTDVQAAVSVIGRRDISRENPEQTLNLSYTNLSGANLERAKLQRANFYKSNFKEACLREAKMQGAYLQEANLIKANLADSDLYDVNLCKAKLQGAILVGACLEGGVSFIKAQLHKANLYRARLQGASFEEAKLKGANFKEANLQHVNFSDADLRNAIFSSAKLCNTEFKNTRLQKATFENTDLQAACFDEANLQGASFKKAKLQDAILLESSDLKDTDFTDANLQHAAIDSLEQFKDSKLCRTIMPDGTVWNRDCEESGLPDEE